MRMQLPSQPVRLAILARVNADLARGPLTPEEDRDFDVARAFEMHRAELRRNPAQIAPELPLANWRDCAPPSGATSQATQPRTV